MSVALTIELSEEQMERLTRASEGLGRSPSDVALLLLEESLRQRDFPSIEFRDSVLGRQPYLQGTRLAVWQIAWLARHLRGGAEDVAAYLEIPPGQVASALRYADAFPADIEAAITENTWSSENIERLLPGLRVTRIDASAP